MSPVYDKFWSAMYDFSVLYPDVFQPTTGALAAHLRNQFEGSGSYELPKKIAEKIESDLNDLKHDLDLMGLMKRFVGPQPSIQRLIHEAHMKLAPLYTDREPVYTKDATAIFALVENKFSPPLVTLKRLLEPTVERISLGVPCGERKRTALMQSIKMGHTEASRLIAAAMEGEDLAKNVDLHGKSVFTYLAKRPDAVLCSIVVGKIMKAFPLTNAEVLSKLINNRPKHGLTEAQRLFMSHSNDSAAVETFRTFVVHGADLAAPMELESVHSPTDVSQTTGIAYTLFPCMHQRAMLEAVKDLVPLHSLRYGNNKTALEHALGSRIRPYWAFQKAARDEVIRILCDAVIVDPDYVHDIVARLDYCGAPESLVAHRRWVALLVRRAMVMDAHYQAIAQRDRDIVRLEARVKELQKKIEEHEKEAKRTGAANPQNLAKEERKVFYDTEAVGRETMAKAAAASLPLEVSAKEEPKERSQSGVLIPSSAIEKSPRKFGDGILVPADSEMGRFIAKYFMASVWIHHENEGDFYEVSPLEYSNLLRDERFSEFLV